MASRLESLLGTGELQRAARTATCVRELAEAVGLTHDQFRNHVKRIRRAGRPFPSFDELKRAGEAYAGDIRKPDNSPRIEAREPRTVADDLADRRRRTEVDSLKSRLQEALDQLEQCKFELGQALSINEARHDVPPIRPRERSHTLREATAVALASDWHIEETVDAAAVNGVNEYDLNIAKRRVERFFSSMAYLHNYHRDHFLIRDQVLWLGGDLITGYLREEDLECNALSPVNAIATLAEWIPQGVRSFLQATEVERLIIPCNSGNHGRLTKKVQPRSREANSIEWLLYFILSKEFANEPRVQLVLPRGVHTYLEIYNTILRFTHGDATKYGGGVGGIMIPIRKAIAKWDTVRRATATILGHYHSEHFLRDLIVNGSLIGYNSFALDIAAPFEEPRQAFFLVDKERGISMPASMHVEDVRRAA